MAERIPLTAPEGHVLTNGKGTTGFVIYVEVGMDENEYYPITIEEYEQTLKADEGDIATDLDYENALRGLGVLL